MQSSRLSMRQTPVVMGPCVRRDDDLSFLISVDFQFPRPMATASWRTPSSPFAFALSSALWLFPGSSRRNVQCDGLANERLQRLFIDLVALMEIDCAPGVAFEAGVEEV